MTGLLLLSERPPGAAALSVRPDDHRDFLQFGSGPKIIRSCKHYVTNKAGLWEPVGGLRGFLFDGTD